MDHKCYKEKVPMEEEIHDLKIAVGAVVVLMVIEGTCLLYAFCNYYPNVLDSD
ncbi:hypothetical protein RvY_19174 [Ramazzottius varieornatus]|uniref:Uncharacterized protein n=1 Tax=Ramazzottius varieornatus TaxID=947166 RepID=A0A1D1W8H2_RAMVA|nr:hypothetical protein RvY_19174 [Ramazzottius varieornatus]